MISQVEANKIVPGNNDRKHFTGIDDLARNINEHGLAQPITVRPHPQQIGHFEIVAGERRFRATQQLGWQTVPAIVRELDDETASAIMLSENTSRADLNPIEEAEAYQARIDRGWSITKIAEVAGVSEQRVKDRLELLKLVPEIRELVKFGNFPLGHALATAQLDNNRQRIAMTIFNSSSNMPLRQYRAVVSDLLEEQNQEQLFNLESFWVQQNQNGEEPVAARGKRARTGAPINKELPPVRWKSTDSLGDIFDRYIADLLKNGNTAEAHAIGNLYNVAVRLNLVQTPQHPELQRITNNNAPVSELSHDTKID